MEFIEADPHRALPVAGIAASAHVGTGAIQLAVRRHLGPTPTAFMRDARVAGTTRPVA